MTKVREGDLDKLGLLFERYKKPLYGFFYGHTKEQALSEDLVQNTFLRMLKYRHLFRGDGDFRAWMFHIARNVRIDNHRAVKIKTHDQPKNWEEHLVHHENQAVLMEQEEQHQMLAKALDKLPIEKREVLLLSKYQEKRYSEIGVILGCSEGAVKVKVFRALQELKNIYQELEKSY